MVSRMIMCLGLILHSLIELLYQLFEAQRDVVNYQEDIQNQFFDDASTSDVDSEEQGPSAQCPKPPFSRSHRMTSGL